MTYNISGADALRVLGGRALTVPLGHGSLFVLDQRLPRAVAAALVGAMLALSGAVFQSLSRNPLGSPDIVGFTTGASSGGLFMLLLAASASDFRVSVGAVLGGFATAAVVALVSRRGGVGGDNLILTGVALSEVLSAANELPSSRGPPSRTPRWPRPGSTARFNAITWAQVQPAGSGCRGARALGRVARAACRSLLEFGDDTATSLGLARSAECAAPCSATASCSPRVRGRSGPIGFLALAAPQLARRVSRSAGMTMIASAAMGALLLGGADFLAQRLLSPFQIPVGLVSAALGGLYLVWLLMAPLGSAERAG